MSDKEIASLRALMENEFKHINRRLEELEKTQSDLVAVANTGKGGLRTALWVGGFMAGLAGIAVSIAHFFRS